MAKRYGINVPQRKVRRDQNYENYTTLSDPGASGVREMSSGNSPSNYNEDEGSLGMSYGDGSYGMNQMPTNQSNSERVVRETVFVTMPEENHSEEKSMTDTVLPVSPIGYGFGAGFAGGGYGAYNNDCLGDVILANQISSVGADAVNATNAAAFGVNNAINAHSIRVSDQLSSGFGDVRHELCEVRHEISSEAARTREVVAKGFCDLSHQMTLQHCEIKQMALEDRNRELRDRLQTLETQNLINNAVQQATA